MARRSVPGAQVSLDPLAQERACGTCQGTGRTRKPPRVRLDLTVEQARALVAGGAAEVRRLANRIADAELAPAPMIVCTTCGGTGVVTILV